MIRPTVLLAALSLAGLAHAQKQEQKLMDRVTAIPDMKLVHPMQGRSFEGGGDLRPDRKASGFNRTAFASRSYDTESAKETRSFLGIKNPWFGPKVFDVKRARLGKHTIPKAEAVYPAEKFESRKYPQGPNTAVQAKAVPVAAYNSRGTAQGAMDTVGEAARKELSVDDIREILNKPR